MKFRKITSVILICTLAILVVACSTDKKETLNNEDKSVSKGHINQDKDLTTQLLEEKEVSSGQIYMQDDWVIGAITIKEGVSEDRAKEVAQKYAEELQAKYKDKKINVQAVLNGNNIANIEL